MIIGSIKYIQKSLFLKNSAARTKDPLTFFETWGTRSLVKTMSKRRLRHHSPVYFAVASIAAANPSCRLEITREADFTKRVAQVRVTYQQTASTQHTKQKTFDKFCSSLEVRTHEKNRAEL